MPPSCSRRSRRCERSRSGDAVCGKRELAALSCDSEQDHATTFPGEPRRQLDARRLRPPSRRRRRADRRRVVVSPPRRRARRRSPPRPLRASARDRAPPREARRRRSRRASSSRATRIASAPSAPTPTTPTVSAGSIRARSSAFRTHEPGSTSARGLERHVVGQLDGRSARERPRTHPNPPPRVKPTAS